jgi:hypothetical protein
MLNLSALETANGSAAATTTTADHKDLAGGEDDQGETPASDRARSVSAPAKRNTAVLSSWWDMGWSRWWRGEGKEDATDDDPGG